MYPANSTFHTLSTQDAPKTRVRVYFIGAGVDCTDDNAVQTNGTLLVGAVGDTDSNGRIGQDGITFTEMFNPDKNIQIGTAVSYQIGMTLLNTDGALNGFSYGRCKVYLDVYDAANSAWLVCPMGVFVIDIPTKRKVQLVSATGYDQMQLLDTICDSWWSGLNWSGGITLSALLTSMANQLGVKVSTATESAILNSAAFFTVAPFSCVEATYRDVLEYVAEVTGTVARFDRDGYLDLRFFGAAQIGGNTVTINADTVGNTCLNIDIAEYSAAAIDLLKVKIAEDDIGVTIGSGTNQYTIVNNPFLFRSTAAIITNAATPIYNRLHGLGAYTPIQAKLIYDWSLEAGDIINIIRDGVTYSVPIFQQTLMWRGGYVTADILADGDKVRPVMGYDERASYRMVSEMSQKVGDNEIISKINQTAESIQIQANRISLLGYTTINNGFKVNIDGTFEANGAKLNGNITSQNPDQSISYKTVISNGIIHLYDEHGVERCYLVAEQGGSEICLNADTGERLIIHPEAIQSYDTSGNRRAVLNYYGLLLLDGSENQVFSADTSGNVIISGYVTALEDLAVSGNVVVSGLLSVPKRQCSEDISGAGWYRVIQTGSPNGARGAIIDINITRTYGNTTNEAHYVRLKKIYNKVEFSDESSVSNVQIIDKIRYTTDANKGYVDIHYNSSALNEVCINFEVASMLSQRESVTSVALTSVADSPAGETVVVEYTLNANGTGGINANGTVTGQGFADLLFGPGVSIASGTDCDTLQSEGKYTAGTTAIASSLSNPPFTTAFGMLIMRVADAKRLVQIAMPNNSVQSIKIRYFNGTSWTAWKTLTPS